MSHGSPNKGPPDKADPSNTSSTKKWSNSSQAQNLPIREQSTDGSQNRNYSLFMLPGNLQTPHLRTALNWTPTISG
jgi:hypothetical protein